MKLMTTVPEVRARVTTRLDEQFLELVCADDQLLEAEFEAIIADAWAARPPVASRRVASSPTGRPRQRAATRGPEVSPGRARRHPGAGGWRRQRSPPRFGPPPAPPP